MMTRFVLCALVLVAAACGDVVRATTDGGPDNCPAGATCECTVETEATACDAHEVCDVSDGMNRLCKCAAAYAEMPDGSCAFTSAPADPGFQDPTKWTVVGTGAAVNAASPGSVQPGELILDKTALCNFSGVKQTFTMPPFDRADPLKVSITTTIDDPMFPPTFFGTFPIQVKVGTQFVEANALRGVYKTQSFCLGPAAFGGPVEISVASTGTIPCASTTTGTLRVDEVKIEVAAPGECPKQAGIVNGNFQLSTGWNFPGTNAGTGQILANIGENNSFGAQLQQPNRCSEVSANGTISIPTEATVAHPALDVHWNGTSGARLVVSLGGKSFGTLNSTNGQVKRSRLCIPKWATGNVTTIGFLAQRVSDNNCGVALGRSFILDNMTIVDEPACGALADITDPSFERIANATGPMPGWGLINGYVNDVEGGRVTIINSSPNAQNGVGVLQAQNTNQCVSAGEFGAELAVIVPAPSGTQGPAIKFAAKAAANVESETRANLTPATSIFATVNETGAYTQNVLCIPPNLAGRLVTFRLSTGRVGGGSCGVNYNEVGFFDDISVGTDPSCPAQ